MSLQYVIDGYNIIHHPLFTQRHNKKIKDSRLSFLEFIITSRLCGSSKNKIIVIFDGYPSGSELTGNSANLDVEFSRKETADERIKKIVEKSSHPKNIVVVSDDKEIKFFAKHIGARSLSVEEFISPKEKFQRDNEDSLKPELTYSKMHKINQELRKIWLE